MSAHKSVIVRLGQAEYQRLRDAEENLRLLALNGMATTNNQDLESIFNRMMSEGQANDHQFIEIIDRVKYQDTERAEVEQETSNWVMQQNEEFQRRLLSAEQNSVYWADQVFAELERRENLLEEKFSRRELLLSERKHMESEDTRQWIEIATQLLQYIQEEYDLDLVSANEFELQRSEIDEAIRQYNQGRDDRAWSSAKSAWNALTRLRHHLEIHRSVIAACRAELKIYSKRVVERISLSQLVNAMDGEGCELPEQIDVDYWTDGDYSCLVKQASQAQSEIDHMHEGDLTEMAEWREELSLLDDRAVDLITQARLAVLASQLRFNVAQIVVRALESQGFYLEEANYDQNDFRGTFSARTRSRSGSEVVVTIDPDPGLEEGGRMHIRSNDALNVTEHELQQRNHEIFQAIRQEGLDLGETKTNIQSPAKMNLQKSHMTLSSRNLME